MNQKKRLVYRSVVFIWVVVPAYEITYVVLTSGIVDGVCMWYPAYMSEMSKVVLGLVNWFFTYCLPMVTMVFCYARVVYTLRTKVSLSSMM